MDQRTHRLLAVITAGVAGTGGLISVADPASLGIEAGTWELIGNWMSFLGGFVAVGVTLVRQYYGTAPTGP